MYGSGTGVVCEGDEEEKGNGHKPSSDRGGEEIRDMGGLPVELE